MPPSKEPLMSNQLTLQRLIDNELNHDQIRKLLSEAEAESQQTHWKKIALAFIENQLFERTFCEDKISFAQTPVANAVETAKPGSKEILGTAPPVKESPRPLVSNRWWWSVVLAASVLFVGVTVYQWSDLSRKPSDMDFVQRPLTIGGSSPAIDADSRTIESFDRTTLASYQPDHQLKTDDLHSNPIPGHNRSIALYNANRFDPSQLAHLSGNDMAAKEAMFARVLPESFSPEVIQGIRQSGGMVDQNLEFISGRLNDGRSYLIPYRTIRFLPGQ